jgi:PKD repeat protein
LDKFTLQSETKLMRILYKNPLLAIFILSMGVFSQAFAQDAGVTKILLPSDSTCGSSANLIKAIVFNYGSSSISNIPVWASSTGAFSISLKDTLKKTIAAGKQDTITFKATFNNNSGGTGTFKIFTNISGDTKRSNDTLIKKLYFFAFPNAPTGIGSIICGSGPLKFKAKSPAPGFTFWYPTSSAAQPFQRGDSISPVLSATTTYYAATQVALPQNVTTNFSGVNNQNGNMINIRVLKDISIDSFDVSLLNSGTDTIHFFYRSGFVTSTTTTQLSSSGWTDGGKYYINISSAGTGTKTRTIFNPLILKSGDYTFYIFTQGAYSSSTTDKLNYTTASSFDTVSTGSIRVITAFGVAAYFGSGNAGNFFSPRAWNGTVYYSNLYCSSTRVTVTSQVLSPVKGITLSKNKTSAGIFNVGGPKTTDEICVGDSFKYDISTPTNFLNSDYGTKWKLTYAMKSPKGTPTINFVSTSPSASVKGLFVFLPKTADADSVYVFTIKVTNLVSGCDSIFTRYIHVNQVAKPQFTVGNVCFGQPLSITNTSTPTGKLKFVWDFGNGDTSTAATPAYKYKGASTYTISLLASTAACQNAISKTVTVYNAPYGSNFIKGSPFRGQLNTGDVLDPDNVCLNDTNVYQVSSPKGLSNSDYGTKWVFTSISFATVYGTGSKDTAFKKPTVSKNGSFSFFPSKNTDSVFILKMIIRTMPGNCDSLMIRYIHVRVKPIASYKFTNACAGSPISFVDGSTVSISSVTSWKWDFADGSTSTLQNPAHSYAAPGSYKVTLTAFSDAGCSNSISNTVQQYPRATVKFGQLLSCNRNVSVFTDSTKITGVTVNAWKWNFGEPASSGASGSTVQNPNHVFAKSGFYTVKLVTTTSNGCKDSFSRKERILFRPVPSFTYQDKCVGDVYYFGNGTMDTSTKITYLWNFGDGVTSTSVLASHAFAKNGSYNMSLIASSSNGCADTFKAVVTPISKPVVRFSATTACTGGAVGFSDSSHAGPNAVLTWTYGDGSAQDIGKGLVASHVFAKAGKYKVNLSIINNGGCTDTLSKFITIVDYPHAAFKATDVCIGNATSFANNSTGGVLTYKWNFGDNTGVVTSKDVTHIYTKPGTFPAKLSVYNTAGCQDTAVATVNVRALPAVPKWVRNQNRYTVNFVPKDTTLTKYVWYFGTGDSSSKKKPTYTYPTADGKYQVKLVVTSAFGCSNTNIDSVYTGKFNGIDPATTTFSGVEVYPNPFEESTTISYKLETASKVTISVYDIQGKQVAQLKDGKYPAGQYTDAFDARKYSVAKGVYFLKVVVNDKYFNTRIVNLK